VDPDPFDELREVGMADPERGAVAEPARVRRRRSGDVALGPVATRRPTLARLRRRGEDVLRGVAVPDPFDLELFCRGLAEQRGRPLQIMPLPQAVAGGGPCGAWVATTCTDYLFYDPVTSPLHGDHIVLHEVGHLLAEHTAEHGAGPQPGEPNSQPGVVPRPELLLREPPSWLPDLSGEAVRHVFGRTTYSSPQEQEAEIIATLILERGSRRRVPAVTASGSPADAAKVLERLSHTLGARPGRD